MYCVPRTLATVGELNTPLLNTTWVSLKHTAALTSYSKTKEETKKKAAIIVEYINFIALPLSLALH